MRLKRIIVPVLVGLVAAVAFAPPPDCMDDLKPCLGPETPNGDGCNTTCPPVYENDGCCQYYEFRVNCTVGEDAFYRLRECKMIEHCSDPINPKSYFCNVL